MQVVGVRRSTCSVRQDLNQLVYEMRGPVIGQGPAVEFPNFDFFIEKDLYVTVPPIGTDVSHKHVNGLSGAFEDLGEPFPRGDQCACNVERCVACSRNLDNCGDFGARR